MRTLLSLSQDLITASKRSDPGGEVLLTTISNTVDHNYSLVVQDEVEVEVTTSEDPAPTNYTDGSVAQNLSINGASTLLESFLPPVAVTEEVDASSWAAILVSKAWSLSQLYFSNGSFKLTNALQPSKVAHDGVLSSSFCSSGSNIMRQG